MALRSLLASTALIAASGAACTGGYGGSRRCEARNFYRVSLAPGMGHRGVSPGPGRFFNGTISPVPADTEQNALLAPQRIAATKHAANRPAQRIARIRPPCPRPRVARHRDPSDAAGFACVRGGGHDDPIPAPEHLR